MNQRKKEKTIEVGDTLIFDTGYQSKVHSIIPVEVILEDNHAYSKVKLYIGVDTGHIKIQKKQQ